MGARDRRAHLRDPRLVAMGDRTPTAQSIPLVAWVVVGERVRKAREERMRIALERLATVSAKDSPEIDRAFRYVRATAREGLGRDPAT